MLRSSRLAWAVFLAVWLALAIFLPPTVRAQAVRHLDEVHTPRTYESLEEWLGRAHALRTHVLVSAGLWPMPERTPLSARLSEPVERDGYTIQSVLLETIPGFYLTGNLFRPLDGDGPHPAVLSAHGHWAEGRFEDSELASIPGRAIHFARRGYVVLSYSMIGYNETADLLPHRFSDPRYELWGFTPMGLQLWNGIRALDFLSGLPDVDSTRIGMTGASGGGTQTFLLTAVDPRIKVSAPVNMISAYMQGGCVCENAPLLRLDATNVDVAALAAPRPMLMVSTSGDWTSNTPAVEYPAVRSVYRLFGAEDRIANVHLDYPHNYNRESREAVYAWFDRWLQGVDASPPEAPLDVGEPMRAELPSTARDLAGAFETFRSRSARKILDTRPTGWPDLYAYRDRFGTAFRHVFRSVPEPDVFELDVHEPEGRTGASPAVLVVRLGEDAETPIGMESDRPVHGAESEHGPSRPESERGASRAESEHGASRPESEQAASWRMVFTLRPYPREFVAPDTIAHWTTYNATTAARRVDEIRRTIEWIQSRPDVTEVDLVGLGAAGPVTMLARALVSDVHDTVIDFDGFRADEDAAYVDELFVPLLRRAGDLRTAAALIAPARLEIRNLADGPLRAWILDVYRAAGAEDMLRME